MPRCGDQIMIDHVSDELLSPYTIGLPEESELGWEEEDFLICGCSGDSGEAERWFRKEAEQHSGMIPNTIGA